MRTWRCLGAGALLLAAGAWGCSKDRSAGDEAGAPSGEDSGPGTSAWSAFARAEDLRQAKEVPGEARTSRDVRQRRRAARAYARVADADASSALLEMLSDEDDETLAWVAYGLGYACKGREEVHVKALVARAATLGASPEGPEGARPGYVRPPDPRGIVDARTALARAVGRCGTPLAEDVLVSWLRSRGALAAPAALGLGDLAARRKSLRPDTVHALVEGSSGPAGALVFHALARVAPDPGDASRVLGAARSALAEGGDSRILAIKALAKSGKEAVPALSEVVLDGKGHDFAERAEAARGLGGLGEAGHEAAADALIKLVPPGDPVFIESLSGPLFGLLATLLDSLGEEPPRSVETTLYALANLEAPNTPRPLVARRIHELRCAAALGLAHGAWDTPVLKKCADPSSEAFERARLRSLLRRPIAGDRRAVFRNLARSAHLRVRELAVEAIGAHGELGDTGRELLAEALASSKAGLVATAADVVHAHPDRVLALAERERRAALDPRSPPPTAHPAKELDPRIKRALESALASPWPEDRFETRISLLEAAVTLGLPGARALVAAACEDPNVTVRERAQVASKSTGEARICASGREGKRAPELAAPPPRAVTIAMITDSGSLRLLLEPELSPVTVARVTSLARSNFYNGIVVHRVVPGFVVQFGDPEGDGYGGSGASLRCETSPAPFMRHDVGMALAGRDTGSSQLFVTLSRTPHLDGEYTRLGRAEGDLEKLAEGDVIRETRVTE